MKKLLLVGVVLSSVFAPIAQAATTLKISTAYPGGTFVMDQLKTASKDITAQTDGRVKLKIYPGGVQGGNQSVLKKIKKGLLAGVLIEGGALAVDYKDSQVYNAPMFFSSYEEVDAVRKEMDSVIESGFKDAGWNTYGLVEGGFAYAMTNTPATSIAQLQKQKLWLPANDPLVEKIANVMGISPIYLGIAEVLTGLSTNSINAIVAPPIGALTLQWFNKVKYYTDVPFMYTYATLALSDKALKKVSAEDQKIMADVLNKALYAVDQANRVDNLNSLDALVEQGVKPVKPNEVDLAGLNAGAKNSVDQLIAGGQFSQVIFDQMKSIVDAFRLEKMAKESN